MTKVDRGPAYAKVLLAELKVSGPANAHIVAEQLQLDVNELDVKGFDGALVRAKGTPFGVIIVRDSIRESGRKNFTVAHEIGHFCPSGSRKRRSRLHINGGYELVSGTSDF